MVFTMAQSHARNRGLDRIYNMQRRNYAFMKLKDFKTSDAFESILAECLGKKNLSLAWIQKKWKLSFQKAKMLYEEVKHFDDEVFFHGCLYELSFMKEPPTVARIMVEFDVGYLLAKKIFEFYTENC